MSDFSHANKGDTVTLVDGSVGTVKYASRFGIEVAFPPTCPHDDKSGGRSYEISGQHVHNLTPPIKHIGPPTMATPYDTEIANAEKALADLKAKAIAEAAKKALPPMKVGQVWKTRAGKTVRLAAHTEAGKPQVKFIADRHWYYDNYRNYVNNVSNTNEQDQHTLVELVSDTSTRWYKDIAEFMAFANAMKNAVITRPVGSTRINGTIRPIVGESGKVYFTSTGSDITGSNFDGYEYSMDNKTWSKFGVAE